METPSLLSAKQYVVDATHKINNAKERVYLLTLVLSDDKKTERLIDALCAAADRGVEVVVSADLFFTYRELYFSRFKHPSKIRLGTGPLGKMKNELSRHGVKFEWLGQHGLIMFSRRTHNKWCIVDDIVYSFGGVNLYPAGIDSLDFMIRIKRQDIADCLVLEHKKIINQNRAGRAHRSYEKQFKPHTILMDGGLSFDSIIYSRVCRYAKKAKHITFVSQYGPTGKLLDIIAKHKNAEVYFNQWRHTNSANRLYLLFASLYHRFASRYQKKQYLHAKYIIFTMENGEEIAITGSHNFTTGGVWLGTREVALETNDKHIVQLLRSYLNNKVK